MHVTSVWLVALWILPALGFKPKGQPDKNWNDDEKQNWCDFCMKGCLHSFMEGGYSAEEVVVKRPTCLKTCNAHAALVNYKCADKVYPIPDLNPAAEKAPVPEPDLGKLKEFFRDLKVPPSLQRPQDGNPGLSPDNQPDPSSEPQQSPSDPQPGTDQGHPKAFNPRDFFRQLKFLPWFRQPPRRVPGRPYPVRRRFH